MDEKKVQELWLAFKDGNELGTFQEFKSFMSDPKNRADFHSAFKANAELGDINQFEDYLGIKKKVSSKDSAFNWETGEIDFDKLSYAQPAAPTVGKKSEYNWGGGKNEQLATAPYATSEISSEVKDSPQTAALKSIRERRGTDYSTSAADMASGKIRTAGKKGKTILETAGDSYMSFGEHLYWSADPIDAVVQSSNEMDQRSLAEFNAFSQALSDENREIGLAIKGLESKMKLEYGVDMEEYGGMVSEFNTIQSNASKIAEAFNRLPDNKKTQEEADRVNAEIEKLTESSKSVMQRLEEIQATPEFEEMSNLYELSNINTKKYEDELRTGKYNHAKEFAEYLKERQRLKDESYKKMSGFEKVVNSTGTVILHSMAKAVQSIGSFSDVIEKSVGLEGEVEGVGDKLQNILISIGDDVQGGLPAPSKLQRGGFTDTAKWGEYQVDFTSGGDIQSIRDKDGYIMDAMLSKQQEKEIKSLKKERQFHAQSFAYQTGSTIADVGIQILGTKGIGGVKALPGVVGTSWGLPRIGMKKALGAEVRMIALPRIGMKALGSEVGMIATTAGMMSNDLYNEGLENGLSEDDAARYALSTGTVIGLVGTLAGVGIEEQLLLKSKIPSIELRDKMPGFVGRKVYDVIKGGAGEFTEEIILEKLGQAGVQYAMNEMAGGKFDIQPYKDTTSIINEAATAVVAGGLFSLAKSGKKANGMQRSMLADGAKDIPKTIEMVKEVAAATGQPLTIAEEAELKQELEITKAAVEKIPEEQKTNPEVVETMVEKTKVDDEIATKKEEIKSIDPAFQQDAKNDIAALEVKSAELALQVAEKAGVTPDEKAVKLLEPKEGEPKPVSATGNNDALRGFNIMGRNFGLDKPSRSDYEEGEAGDKKYADDNINHNKSVDNAILGIKEDGILTDSEGNEYIVTQTSQGARVVNRLADGTEGSDILYRNGKRVSANTPFTNGFTFKPNREPRTSQPVAPDENAVKLLEPKEGDAKAEVKKVGDLSIKDAESIITESNRLWEEVRNKELETISDRFIAGELDKKQYIDEVRNLDKRFAEAHPDYYRYDNGIKPSDKMQNAINNFYEKGSERLLGNVGVKLEEIFGGNVKKKETVSSGTVAIEIVDYRPSAVEGEVLSTEPVLEPVTAGELEVGKTYYNEQFDRNYVFAGVSESGMLMFDKVQKKNEPPLMTIRTESLPEAPFMKKLFGQKTEQAAQVQEPTANQQQEPPIPQEPVAQEPISPSEPIASGMAHEAVNEVAAEEEGDVSSPNVGKRLRGFYANSLKKMGGATPGQGILAKIAKTDPQFYEPMSRAGNAQAVANEIDADGLDTVVQRAMMDNTGEPEGVVAARRIVSLIAIGDAMADANRANDTQALDIMRNQAKELERLLGKKGTEFGQALSMYAIYSQTPEGQLAARLRDVEEKRERTRTRMTEGGRQVGDVVDSIVDEVAKELKLTKEEVVAGLKESITVRNAIIRATKERKQAEKELGEALRAIGKSILGKAGALPSVDIALIKKAFVAIKKLVKNSVTEARIKLSSELQKLGIDPEAALVELETKFPELFVEKNNEDIEKAVKKAAKKESGVAEMTQEELLVEMKRLAQKAREQMEAEKKAARDKVTVIAALMESKKGLDKKSKEQGFVKAKAEAVGEANIKLERERERRAKIAELSAREAVVRKSIADSKKKAAQAEDRYKTIDKVIKALSPKEKSQEKKITEAQEILRGIKDGMGVFIDEKMIEASMENIDPTLPANEIAAKIAAQFNMTKAMEIAIAKTIEKTIGDKVVKAKASRLKQIVRTHVRSAKKARVIENGLLEAITIGGLNDDVIRRKLEEKYGIKSFTNEQINELNQMVMDMKDMPSRGQKFKQMREMMDYIHLHGGIDITSFFAATWYAKVLFSLKTMLSVTVGNEVNFWDNFVVHGLATEGGLYAMKESVKRALQPITSRVGLAEKPYQDRGVWFGLAEGWRFIKTGEASREMKKVARSADLELVSRMSFTEAARDAMTSFANISNIFADVKNADSFREGMEAAMGIVSQLGTTGYLLAKAFAIPHSRVFKYSLRAISAADSLRYYSMLDFTLDRKAYNSAVAEGLEGRAAEARAKEIIGETFQESRAIYEQAVQEFTEYAAQRGRQLNEMFTDIDVAYRAREIAEERLDASWRANMERDASLQGQFDDAVQKVMSSNPGISQVDAEKTARRIRQRYYDNQLSPTEQARFEAEKVALQNDPQGVMGKLAKLLSADFPAVFDEAINAPEPEPTGDKKVDEFNAARAKVKKGMAKVFKTYSSFMFPFMKTMANVVNMKIERFPVLGGGMKFVDAMFGVPSIDWNNSEQKRVFFARQIAGNIILLSVFAYIKSMEDDDEPVITLTGPKDFAKKQGEMETKAWKKETITVGGKRFYFGDTPYAAVLGFMGVREDNLAYAKEGEDDWTTGTMTMALLTQMFTNASYMQTFSNLSTAMQEQDAAKFGAALASPVSGMASSGLQRDLDRWFSPELRDRATIENRFVGEMLSRTPFAANYLLDFRYNSIGEAINPYENEPFLTQAIGLDKYISSTEVSNPIFEVLAEKKVRFKGIGKSINILGTDATYQEKRDYTLFVGRYRNKILSSNLQAMKEMGQEQLEIQLDKTDSEAKRAAELFVLLQRKNKAKADEGQINDVSIEAIDRFINEYDPEMVKQDSEMFMEELRIEKPEVEVDESLFF